MKANNYELFNWIQMNWASQGLCVLDSSLFYRKHYQNFQILFLPTFDSKNKFNDKKKDQLQKPNACIILKRQRFTNWKTSWYDQFLVAIFWKMMSLNIRTNELKNGFCCRHLRIFAVILCYALINGKL